MRRCEWESYVKKQHAVQHLWNVNILTYEENGTLVGLRMGLEQTTSLVRL